MKPYWEQDGNKMIRIYLACPYSHESKYVREIRVLTVNLKAAELMMQGCLVFSPLSHSHLISKYCDVDPCDHGFWLKQDLWILDICDEFHVLCLDGWEESKGIQTELEYAKSLGKKIIYHEL